MEKMTKIQLKYLQILNTLSNYKVNEKIANKSNNIWNEMMPKTA